MSAFLASVKADLLDRRLLPLVALVAALMLGAVAYALLGGSSASAPRAGAGSPQPPAGIAVSEARESPNEAAAETTNGSSLQRQGGAHDPFRLLPGSTGAAAGTASAGASASAQASAARASGATSSAGASGGGASVRPASAQAAPSAQTKRSAPSRPAAPSKPSGGRKGARVYHVSVLFGVLAPSALPGAARLTAYENLKLLAPLPSARQPLLVFRGVLAGGRSASFTLIGEAALHGSARCLPSALSCQEIDLGPGQSEQLEYLGPTGQPVTYELRITRIAKASAQSAAARVAARRSPAGLRLLRTLQLLRLPQLRESSVAGVLTFARPAPAPARSAHRSS